LWRHFPGNTILGAEQAIDKRLKVATTWWLKIGGMKAFENPLTTGFN
jgi:hypothetical protein